MISALLRAVFRNLPVYGLPTVLDIIAKQVWRSATIRRLRVGTLTLRLDLANYVMRNIYFGVFERDLMRFIAKTLRPGDVFIDVGANIGFLTAYAYAHVGPTGAVHCFEPVPQYAEHIQRIAHEAGPGRIIVNATAVGDRDGEVSIKICGPENIGWNTIVPGFMNGDTCASLVVPMTTLSGYLRARQLENVRMIKIDVEGAETLVLMGLFDYLETGARPVIVTEVTPHASVKLGTDLPMIVARMHKYGYRPQTFDRRGVRAIIRLPIHLIPIDPLTINDTTDIVWLPE